MISSAEQKRREAAAQYARATVALEGGQQMPIAAKQLARFVEGETSIEQAIEVPRL
ncbi:antitoxin VbhA family protein [Pseudomonas stutzeri]|uniref:antitoxin VbhA family protein n=1 Tax=Stutzerimonas stutzeri TaxID=316 RepID=UPI0011AEE345|nr:antitoxin VbhA family protein [Stutzerimonas stutzeri]MCQ4297696.1 antitoxin VbhA family protein [Stutzerimonas stutzeri]